MSDTQPFLPSPDLLLALGYGMPQRSVGAYPSTTYSNIELTKAVVVWPASGEVRLAVKPVGHTSWSTLYHGRLRDAEALYRAMAIECFIFPEQAAFAARLSLAEGRQL